MNTVHIGWGEVRHTRLRPQRHRFAYRTYFLLLPMRSLHLDEARGGLAINQRAGVSFYDADHGDARGPEAGGALAWLEELLQQEAIHDADGEIWLHTYPRVLGYAFKPVSFWYCHRQDGSLRAIVVEVNNTFGERHCYLLDSPRYGVEMVARKCFHVSPFCRVSGLYRFRFMRTTRHGQERTVVRVDHDDTDGPLINTSVSGTLEPVTPTALRRALWQYPAMTFMVVARIHWQALQLWLKRVRFFSKPPAPDHFVTRT
jgi:DUF1365 family protein